MPGWDDFVLVGRVARTHGRRGEVIVNPETDFPDDRFAPGAAVWILRDGIPVSATIRSAWTHKGRPVIALEMPLVEAFCVDIDVAARRIVVRPPEGLIGLNG